MSTSDRLGASQVVVLIATHDRNDLLFTRALRSVFAQSHGPSRVVLVDDSDDPANTDFLRRSLVDAPVPIDIIRNRRTRGASGAWNSGLDHLAQTVRCPTRVSVAFLDDDDAWNLEHLSHAHALLQDGAEIVATPFHRLEDGFVRKCVRPPETLRDRDFLIGNPGIQASNLIVRLDFVLEAGCFDEALTSCTDRDLCIRLARGRPANYRRTRLPTVDHYACSDRRRLSTPGSAVRQQGLDGFLAKYGPQMRPDEHAAFIERATAYFGWRPTSATTHETHEIDSFDGDHSASADAFHLIVGLIADQERTAGLVGLFDDLLLVQQEPGILELDVVVMENGPCRAADPQLAALVEGCRQRGLRLHLIDKMAWSEACVAGEIAIASGRPHRRLDIAAARTVLQTCLYHFAKSRRGAVVWVLDDDIRLAPLVQVKGGLRRQFFPIAPQLRRMRAAGLDIAIGRYTGAAPLPAIATVRVQLVDLVWNLRQLAMGAGTELDPVANNARLRRGRRDYYYDLSHMATDRLETPFVFSPLSPTETAAETTRRLLALAPRVLAGEQVFRPLVLDRNPQGIYEIDDRLDRGGNTFVLDIEALNDVPNLVPEVDGRPTRRSDMIWSLLQRTDRGRRVGGVPTAVYHERAHLPVPQRLEVDAIVDDIRGYAVFGALRDHRASPDVDVGERSRKYQAERLAVLRLSLHRIRGLAQELDRWARDDAPVWSSPSEWSAFAGLVLDLFSADLFERIERAVLCLDPEQVRRFVAKLPSYLDVHRSRMGGSGQIEARLAEQRTANAQAIVEPLAPPGAQLTVLGQGSEGVALTDGSLVYKVFDYWKEQDARRALDLLPTLVGQWTAARALYPIRGFERRPGGFVLIYPFEPSEPYRGGHGPGLVELLVECHRHGIVCRNLHPKNLRVVDGVVRLIDYGSDLRRLDDPEVQSDNFVAMCRRAFLSWRWAHREDLHALMKRSLSEPDLPELEGFERFLQAVREVLGVGALEDPVLLRARQLNPRNALDYGAGKGKLAAELAAFVGHVVAYDPDPAVADRLRGLAASGVQFVPSAAVAVASGPFDLVVCRRVACLLDDDELAKVLLDLRSTVASEGRVLLALCHPVYTPHCVTAEAWPTVMEGNDPEYTFVWHKTVRSTGRTVREVHRPEHRLSRLVQRAGFAIVARRERTTVDLERFEPINDILMLELVPSERPDVTLLIKACAMEAETLDVQVRHLVASLERPRGFAEIVIALDDRRDGFPRQHGRPDISCARRVASTLLEQGWIDRIVETPEDPAALTSLNQRWLGVASASKHASNGAQLAVLFAAFESCREPFVLHADADVMIGRRDTDHDYLGDMLTVIRDNPGALTVAFNIARLDDSPYSSDSQGIPWRTESRIGLVALGRLRSKLPLPSAILHEAPEFPWHRALDRAIANGAGSSWRGGNHQTFFVHPPNERKTDRDAWFSVLDRVEQGKVPWRQCGQVDWVGDVEVWIVPERLEPFVFIIAGRNVPPGRFRRCLESVLRQRRRDWGAVVLDDSSTPTWAEEISTLCRPHRDRVTFVRRRRRVGLLANMVDAIRRHCGNPTSVIVSLDADDCLIGDAVLDRLHACYAGGADVTVGSMLRTDKHRHYPVTLHKPRAHRGGNVWQHLRSFRKSLFDAIPDDHLRLDGDYIDLANDWAYMLPMIEMATCPRHIEEPLYLHEPSGERTQSSRRDREAVIACLVARPALRTHRVPSASVP
jgi:glycosyltransferase involved in cell wall biosynthesis/SAM-dependent methyltransferase